jgi:arylformamidase
MHRSRSVERLIVEASEERWIDISVPIRHGMVHWPDNPPVVITQPMHLERGDDATVSRVSLGVHTGTHVDAPVHFIAGGTGVDRIGLDRLIGPARVVDLGEVLRITPAELEPLGIRPGARVLFKTRNSRYWNEDRFRADYSYVSLDAARWLVDRDVWTVGIDYLSIGGGETGVETHRVLLGEDVCVIEGLNLAQIEDGMYDLVCLPLRLEGLDGAPARVILRRRGAADDGVRASRAAASPPAQERSV